MDFTSILSDVVVPIIIALVCAVGTTVISLGAVYLRSLIKGSKASEAEKAALGYLVEGVESAAEDFVHLAKKANEDGKLSPEERKAARDLAISHAKTIATGAGSKVLLDASTERLGGWIKSILKAQRKGK